MRNDITRLKSANSWDDRGSSPATPTSKKSGSSPATPPSKKSMVDADVTPESLRRKGYAYVQKECPKALRRKSNGCRRRSLSRPDLGAAQARRCRVQSPQQPRREPRTMLR